MKQNKFKYVWLNELDNVAVSLDNIPADVEVKIVFHKIKKTIKLTNPIAFGHKFAIRHIHKGESILKYGEIIGTAMVNIKPGEHVHIHNLEGTRGRGDQLVKKD